ncbi:polysaccharide biosynthesis/export family protein [Psychroserpens algicola]|uniref:Polysaccharide biosynthesis/export family protein n=1 Tax=Psychroserpens algicola TaxID=1719034 RepID=A0ABT0H8D5_9FLAO|nr:polysaccharide biosynthesis/export family protein [Psychroserpens algicola]MCK8480616.1 polysaccharide biosynthesis/export family protein [Psychroserpens algicola]
MRKQFNNIPKLVLVIALVVLSSCGSRKNIVYFQDEPITNESLSQLDNKFEIRYKPNDILTIDVSAEVAESVSAFNLPVAAYDTSGGVNTQTNILRQTYLIDPDGNIEFPVLGTIKIGGLTRVEATKMLKEKIGEYVKEFIVNIRLINFTITVLGEVNRPGAYTIQDERVSLTEALGLAGDLTIYGKRNNIFLIREVDGQKKYAKYDLTSINVVNSPVYYLSQNDVIYVEPNNTRVKTSTYNPNTGVLISAVSTLATIVAIFAFR